MSSFFTKLLLYFRPACDVVTHDGGFHTDDVFASAVLRMWLYRHGQRMHLTRTRDQKIIEKADIVFDVGQVYDHAKGRYDHHQLEGAGKRDNGIPYAAFGLVWKHYGRDICDQKEEVFQAVDRELVQPIDANDNGIDLYPCLPTYGCGPVSVQQIIRVFNDDFMSASRFAQQILNTSIKAAIHIDQCRTIIRECYALSQQPEILILTIPADWFTIHQCLGEDVLFDPVLYVISPSSSGTKYNIFAISKLMLKENIKKPLPESWRGKDAVDLAKTTGVEDVIMCHRSGFLAKTKSREGALKLAELALKS